MNKETIEELKKIELTQLQQIEAFYKGTDAIAHFAQEVMIPILLGQLSLNEKETAIVGTYYRMYAWMQSLVAMNRPIHFQGVASATRSLFELLLDIKLLSSDTKGDLVEKFHAFPEVEKFRIANKMIKFYNQNHDKTKLNITYQKQFVDAKTQNMDQFIIDHWGRTNKEKPNYPKHWSGKIIAEDRAKSLGLKYHEQYIDIYPELSWHIHSGSTGYVGLDEEALQSVFGTSHSIAQQVFLEATIICGQELHITDALDWFYKSIDELRLVPGKVLVEDQIKILQQRNNNP